MKRTKYYIALAACVFFWSSAFVVSKVALTDMGPVALSVLRIFLCFFILYPVARKHGFHFRDLFHKNSFIYGIFGYGGNLILLTVGLTGCSAGMSSIVHGLFPVFMALFGWLLLSDRMNRFKWLSIALSIAGVLAASFQDITGSHGGSTLWGMGFVALSVITWAFYSVYAKKTAKHLHPFVLTEIFFGTAVISFTPVAAVEMAVTGISLPSPISLVSILYLCVFSGVLATILWNTGVKAVSPTVSGVYFNLTPVVGLLIAVATGESTSLLQLGGCLLIVAGVYVGTKTDEGETSSADSGPPT